MKIVLIGAGNAGWHLGKRFHERSIEIIQVFSRQESKAKRLAEIVGAGFTNDLSKINASADLYLLAVHDDAIGKTASILAASGLQNKLLAHTSGATPMTVFKPSNLQRHGVFYPLQTFSISRQPDFTQIPICVDASNPSDLAFLKKLAGQISPKVYETTDEQRAVLHVAAVFVNNFSNHLFQIGKAILDEEDLPFDLLLPLIRETVAKLDSGDPAAMQTGPAVRGDDATIQRHLAFLKKHPGYENLYRILTLSIQQRTEN